MLLISCMALASAGPLRDVGAVVEAPAALIVVTPGVAARAYDGWVSAIEAQGMDAWVFEGDPGLDVGGLPELLATAVAWLIEERGSVRIAAHGYGGVFALMAGVEAERWALIGVPLGPHAVAGPLSGTRWPWDTSLVGVLPPAKAATGALDGYRTWVTEFPAYTAPTAPTLLVASNLDVVAPPEVVRIPSEGWPDRTWERTGLLSLERAELTHAELLKDPVLARRVAVFIGGE